MKDQGSEFVYRPPANMKLAYVPILGQNSYTLGEVAGEDRFCFRNCAQNHSELALRGQKGAWCCASQTSTRRDHRNAGRSAHAIRW